MLVTGDGGVLLCRVRCIAGKRYDVLWDFIVLALAVVIPACTPSGLETAVLSTISASATASLTGAGTAGDDFVVPH